MFKKWSEGVDACSERVFWGHEIIVAHTIQSGCDCTSPEEE